MLQLYRNMQTCPPTNTRNYRSTIFFFLLVNYEEHFTVHAAYQCQVRKPRSHKTTINQRLRSEKTEMSFSFANQAQRKVDSTESGCDFLLPGSCDQMLMYLQRLLMIRSFYFPCTTQNVKMPILKPLYVKYLCDYKHPSHHSYAISFCMSN